MTGLRAERYDRWSKLADTASLWPLVLPLVLLLPGIASFPYTSPQASFSDITLTHYPYAVFLRDSIVNHHHIPLWSPLFFSGSPFAANPLSGLWYPPGWLALLFPLPLGFNIIVIIHLLWGGIGLYKLLCDEGLDRLPALFGGVAFAAMPKLFAHYGAGHLTLLYAIPWTPWLLYASRHHVTSEKPPFRLFGGISLEAPVLALIFLADPRWGFFSTVVWIAYRLFGIRHDSETNSSTKVISNLAGVFVQGFLALLLAAPLLFPMLEFASLSSRLGMTTAEQMAFSLPFPRLLGLIIPDFGGFHEYMLYAGQAALLLAIAGLLSRPYQRWNAHFWFSVWLLALIFAMSALIPPLRAITRLPLLSLLRVPSRSLFVAGMSMTVMAAYGLQIFTKHADLLPTPHFKLFLVGYASFMVAIAAGISLITPTTNIRFIWGAIFASLCAIWMSLWLRRWIPERVWVAGLFIIALFDLGMIDHTLFSPRAAGQILSEKRMLAEELVMLGVDEGLFRIYSPSYSLPQQTAADLSLQLADGVDPLYLKTYAEYMQRATGVPSSGYSVTVPPFEDRQPAAANANYMPDPVLLGLLSVRYIVSEFALPVDGLEYEDEYRSTRLYRNLRAMPRAWVQPDGTSSKKQTQDVESLQWSPDHIELQAEGPGLVVLSEVSYPGWRVWVDGHPAEMVTFCDLLRSVQIGPGLHAVTFDFRPASVYIGVFVGVIAWSYVAFFWILRRRS